jgi:DNA polymerase III subunit gamma/tau
LEGKKQMFYRKYRPQKFSEISKPNDVASALVNQIQQQKIGHAYLFSGPRGVGKTTTARILAKAINCKKLYKSGDPCDKCEACTGVREGNYLDLIEIDAASNRGIDDIRDLRDKVKLAPSLGEKKVYIIDEVHMLTTEAFNALLKTLEEPPSHAIFILCTTELHKVPDTIKSRCQVFKFKRATIDQLVERLEGISKAENFKTKKDDLRRIAEASLGGFRDAETLLQQVVEGNISVESLLSFGSAQNYRDFVDLIRQNQVSQAIKQVNKVYDEGVDLYVWMGELVKYLRDLLFISAEADEGLVDVTVDQYSKMREQAMELGTMELVKILNAFTKAHAEIKGSFITQLPVELAIVEICAEESMDEGPEEREPVAPDKDTRKTVEDRTVEQVKKRGKEEETPDGVEEIDVEVIDIRIVEEKWPVILEKVIGYNHSIQALLKSAMPISSENGFIIIEVSYLFHKERLELPKNRKIVEGVFSDVLGTPSRLKFRLSKNPPAKTNLTDYNVVIPSAGDDAALDIFDGELPLR